jgi:hypothetical protein
MVSLQACAAIVCKAFAEPYAAGNCCVAAADGKPEGEEEEVVVVCCSYAVGGEGAVVIHAQHTPAGQHAGKQHWVGQSLKHLQCALLQ